MPCVICPFDKCSPDCIFLEVFAAEQPFTDESVLNAQKIITSFKMDYIKKHLLSCKQSGGLKLMKECIFRLLKKRIDKCTKRYGPSKDFSIMKDVDPALVHWYKKRHGLLEDGSSDEGVDAQRLKMFQAVLD
ncbi:hypothetical protein Tco_0093816 [Tanacetum coccineum]